MLISSPLSLIVVLHSLLLISNNVSLIESAPNLCPFQLEIWRASPFNIGGCNGNPDSTTEIYANLGCFSNDARDSPGNYRATCNDEGQFVFVESGCEYSDCRESWKSGLFGGGDGTCGKEYAFDDKSLPIAYATTDDGVNTLGECWRMAITNNRTGFEIDAAEYRITGDCNCTWAPTMSPAPTLMPSEEPTPSDQRIFNASDGEAVQCTSDDDKCDFRRCGIGNGSAGAVSGDVDFFGSEGKVKFTIGDEDEDCTVTCTGDCFITSSASSSLYHYTNNVAGGLGATLVVSMTMTLFGL